MLETVAPPSTAAQDTVARDTVTRIKTHCQDSPDKRRHGRRRYQDRVIQESRVIQ